MRKLLQPSNNQQDSSYPPPDKIDYFQYGIIKDAPASRIPRPGSLADALNVIVYPTEVQGRTGSQLYTELKIPSIFSKTGLTASKSHDIITVTTNVFGYEDVGNFFVWPGEIEEHDEIVEYLSPTQVRVSIIGNKTHLILGCYLRGKNNAHYFHRQRKRWMRQFGKGFYNADIPMTAWDGSIIVSRDVPSNVKSGYSSFDEYSSVFFNSNGIYHIDMEIIPSIAYKINCPIPNIEIRGNQLDALPFAFRYRYGAGRLSGNQTLRTRLDPLRIETETGTNKEDVDTNIAGLDKVYLSQLISEDNPHIVGPFWVPIVENTNPQEYQWHYTHYPVWRTMDVEHLYSKTGKFNSANGTFNDPERFIWCHDLRICGAFFGKKRNGIVTAWVGEFEIADVGCVLEWDNGDRDEIIGYIDTYHVRVEWIGDEYYDEEYIGACCIGNGRVMRSTQNGYIVTRTHGHTFTSADVRKTIQWANGYRSYIMEYLNPNQVRVHNSLTQERQGLTLDPRYRYFNDTVNDNQLRSRITSLLLRNRFWEPIPDCNIGVVAPGFMVTGIRNYGEVNYCQLPLNYEYLAGYHNKGYQFSKDIKDDIQMMWVFENEVIIWTSSDTYHVATNMPDLVTVPEVGEAVAVLPGIEVKSPNIGCFDWGSIKDIGNGKIRLLTSEPGFVGMRDFDGSEYSENKAYAMDLGMGRMSKDLNNIYHATASIYNGHDGYVLWGRNADS